MYSFTCSSFLLAYELIKDEIQVHSPLCPHSLQMVGTQQLLAESLNDGINDLQVRTHIKQNWSKVMYQRVVWLQSGHFVKCKCRKHLIVIALNTKPENKKRLEPVFS